MYPYTPRPNERPSNVGILAMEMYVPTRCIKQEVLENISNNQGKYTIGLGQNKMSFVDDYEDITSILMNSFINLIEKYNIPYNTIGRLEIGTETLIDKSKSVKTSIMSLFPNDNSCSDIEGITSINACYGGSAALFNTIAWVESSEWDGRYGIVLCGDIAVYAEGPARPTGGCGAIAMLIGPDAPLILEPGLRSTHAFDCYDFYKPGHSEYPLVDGKLSQTIYLQSVDICYNRMIEKYDRKYNNNDEESKENTLSLDTFDYFVFHAPYNKLVLKGFTRMQYLDFLSNIDDIKYDTVREQYKDSNPNENYNDSTLDREFRKVAKTDFDNKVGPTCTICKNVGNCYTASIFVGLLGLIANKGNELESKNIWMYSYGSGSMATGYFIKGRHPDNENFTIENIQTTTDMLNRLENRRECDYDEFKSAMDMREAFTARSDTSYTPVGSLNHISSGSYYLESINDQHHRNYQRK